MNEIKENICIEALDGICKEYFNLDEYRVSGPKESAVCLERLSEGWAVYEKERNSKNALFLCDN